MKVEIQVSERWIEGFTKAAEEMGLDEAQIPALLKAANLKMARDADPAKFDEGEASVMGEKRALFWLPMMAGLGLGATGLQGARQMGNSMGQSLYNTKMLGDLARFNAQKAQLAAHRNLLTSAVGPGPGAGYGMGGFGPYGYPF